MCDEILEQVRKINDCVYISEKDYYKIKVVLNVMMIKIIQIYLLIS